MQSAVQIFENYHEEFEMETTEEFEIADGVKKKKKKPMIFMSETLATRNENF